MPLSAEMPAPVRTTTEPEASRTRRRIRSSRSSMADPYRTRAGGASPDYRGGVSSALTEGIRVTVRSAFRAERSDPEKGRWLFSYTVRIANEGDAPAQLVSRHWIITDAHGAKEEVVGDGVIGQQPRLEPGQHFEYTSFCVLA